MNLIHLQSAAVMTKPKAVGEKKAKHPNALDVKAKASKLRVILPTEPDQQLSMQLGLSDPVAQESDWFFTSPIFLFQCCLPFSQLSEDDLEYGAWTRMNGAITMKVTTALRDSTRIPCGKFPRQFLMWLTNAISLSPQSLTEVEPGSGHPAGSRIFHINTTMRQFCESVGVDPSTGKNGSGKALIEQIIRLMACSFSIAREERLPNGKMQLSVRRLNISSAMSVSWNDDRTTGAEVLKSLEGGFLLSSDFYEEIVTKSRRMVLPKNHVSTVCKGKSPLRIDAYHFVMIKNWQMHKRNQTSVTIPWTELYAQFGSTGSLEEFIKAFRNEIRWLHANVLPEMAPKLTERSLLTLYRFPHPTPLTRSSHYLQHG